MHLNVFIRIELNAHAHECQYWLYRFYVQVSCFPRFPTLNQRLWSFHSTTSHHLSQSVSLPTGRLLVVSGSLQCISTRTRRAVNGHGHCICWWHAISKEFAAMWSAAWSDAPGGFFGQGDRCQKPIQWCEKKSPKRQNNSIFQRHFPSKNGHMSKRDHFKNEFFIFQASTFSGDIPWFSRK